MRADCDRGAAQVPLIAAGDLREKTALRRRRVVAGAGPTDGDAAAGVDSDLEAAEASVPGLLGGTAYEVSAVEVSPGVGGWG